MVWDGFTGVDSEGAEEAASFYVNGRPFLYLPKPKEYEGSIRAYTYPDEFEPMMGIVEATDGMFLDSQVSESFDLSYRTIVEKSSRVGYKLHLVYNAIVVPQSVAFEALSDSINPIEFSWDIKAVPVRVGGYRSTAHIVIDTTEITMSRLEQIETLLYGTNASDPVMPSPRVIFDILSSGDTIVVTVHDDGTWSARGSDRNVYMVSPGVFQIDNVNATHNEDGTFTITTGGNTVVQ